MKTYISFCLFYSFWGQIQSELWYWIQPHRNSKKLFDSVDQFQLLLELVGVWCKGLAIWIWDLLEITSCLSIRACLSEFHGQKERERRNVWNIEERVVKSSTICFKQIAADLESFDSGVTTLLDQFHTIWFGWSTSNKENNFLSNQTLC